MRSRNTKYILIVVALLVLGFGVGRLSAAAPSVPGGSLDSPGPPETTYSYTLEDIYDRLDTGAEGAQRTFTEPTSGPTVGTGHTLSEIMAKAPSIDNTNGATQTHVLAARTFWGLTSGQWGLVTGTAASAPVPKTGQAPTMPINPAPPGSDGALQRGVAWPSPRFITSTAGIVTDTLTGLIWLKDANCINTEYPSFDNDDIPGDGRVTWQHALDFVAGINVGTYSNCGGPFTDWRLPNAQELQSLTHFAFYNPALSNTIGTGKWTEGDPFTGVQSGFYWSSTTCADYSTCGWMVNMMWGASFGHDKVDQDYVWPVRGGQ